MAGPRPWCRTLRRASAGDATGGSPCRLARGRRCEPACPLVPPRLECGVLRRLSRSRVIVLAHAGAAIDRADISSSVGRWTSGSTDRWMRTPPACGDIGYEHAACRHRPPRAPRRPGRRGVPGCLPSDRARRTLGGRRPRALLRDARGRDDDGPCTAAARRGACRARGGARGGTDGLVLLLDRGTRTRRGEFGLPPDGVLPTGPAPVDPPPLPSVPRPAPCAPPLFSISPLPALTH